MTESKSPRALSKEEKEKLKLEAELLKLDLEERKAEAVLRKAELSQMLAEAKQRKTEAENRLALSNLDHANYIREYELKRVKRNQRVYDFQDSVGDFSVETLLIQLRMWESQDEVDGEKRPIMIRFKSPGGSVLDGFDLYDYVVDMRERGWKIDTLATGIAASMAGILLQMGEERLMTKHATLHMHEVGTFTIGKTSEIKDEIKFIDALEDKGARIYAERSTLSPEEVKEMWARKEVFLSANEALKLKLVDRIV